MVGGIGLLIRSLPVRFPAVQNDVSSLGTAPDLPRGNVPVPTVSRSGKERLLND